MLLSRLRYWIFLSLVFLIPVAMNPWGVEIYSIPKDVILKVGVGLMVGLWAWEVVRVGRVRVFFEQRAGMALAIFLGILGVSLATSVRPLVSFWGAYETQGGMVNMLYYALLFVMAAEFWTKAETRRGMLKALCYSGTVVSLYALCQWAGVDFLPQTVRDFFEGRSFSSLGNPSALGTFLLFSLGAELALWRGYGGAKKSAWARVGLMLLALVSSRARAAILGLVVAGFLLGVKRWKWKAAGAGLVAVVIFALAYGGSTRSLESRFSLWESSVEMIAARPLAGYGLENFEAVFPQYVRGEFYEHEDYYNVADRPHSEFLEWWISLGALGEVFYVGLVIFVLRTFWHKRGQEEALAAALVSVGAANFFGFSGEVHFMLAAIFLAFLCAGKERVFAVGWVRVAVGIVGVGAVAAGFFWAQVFWTDLVLKRADTVGRVDSAVTSVFAKPYLLAFKIEFGRALKEKKLDALSGAIVYNQKAYDIEGGSFKTLTNFANVYTLEGHMEEAEKMFAQLDAQTRVQPLLYQLWGEFYYQQEKYAEALMQYERMLAALPEDWKAPVITKGEMSEASRIFWKNHPDFFLMLQHMADAYQKTGRSHEGEELLLQLT